VTPNIYSHLRVLLILSVFVPLILFAQDMSFLSDQGPNSLYEFETIYGGSESTIHFSGHNLAHNFKLENQSVLVGARYQKLDLEDRHELLRDFENIQGTLGYRRTFGGDKFWSLTGSYGSASDRPFKNSKDGTLSLNYVQKLGQKWFGILNYSNNRPFLNNIPLPGFFWVKEMRPDRGLIIGFPFIYWMQPISESVALRVTGLIPWNYRIKFLLTPFQTLKPFLVFEQAPLNFWRHDRENINERFFWFERRLGLGGEGRLMQKLAYDFSAGLAFDRRFYEAKNFNDSKRFLVTQDSGPYVALNLKYYW
jgi:hypothetical protein